MDVIPKESQHYRQMERVGKHLLGVAIGCNFKAKNSIVGYRLRRIQMRSQKSFGTFFTIAVVFSKDNSENAPKVYFMNRDIP